MVRTTSSFWRMDSATTMPRWNASTCLCHAIVIVLFIGCMCDSVMSELLGDLAQPFMAEDAASL